MPALPFTALSFTGRLLVLAILTGFCAHAVPLEGRVADWPTRAGFHATVRTAAPPAPADVLASARIAPDGTFTLALPEDKALAGLLRPLTGALAGPDGNCAPQLQPQVTPLATLTLSYGVARLPLGALVFVPDGDQATSAARLVFAPAPLRLTGGVRCPGRTEVWDAPLVAGWNWLLETRTGTTEVRVGAVSIDTPGTLRWYTERLGVGLATEPIGDGQLITAVGEAAMLAGVRRGDVLIGVDGSAVAGLDARNVQALLTSTHDGPVELLLSRDGRMVRAFVEAEVLREPTDAWGAAP